MAEESGHSATFTLLKHTEYSDRWVTDWDGVTVSPYNVFADYEFVGNSQAER